MTSLEYGARLTRRHMLKLAIATGVGLGAVASPPHWLHEIARVSAAPVRRFPGTTIRILFVANPFWDVIKELAPSFEERSGIKVEVEPLGFPVLLQRLELELGTGSSTYDIAQMAQILIGRTITAGWATDLMPFARRDSFNLADFVPGTIKAFTRNEALYALPWIPDAMVIVYRKDLFEKAGVNSFPATFNEMMAVAPRIHSKETAFFVCANLWHWTWPQFMQSWGGSFFVNPPDDLTPAFNSAAAVQSAEFMVELISRFGVANAVNVNDPISQALFQQGRVAVNMGGLGSVQSAVDRTKSQVADHVAFAHVPRGSAGSFPQLAMHGYMIPAASRRKDAAWEVMKWLTSVEVDLAMVSRLNMLARPRYSTLRSPEMKRRAVFGGTDVTRILTEVMFRAGAGYMAYRAVPPFPPVGGRVNVAFGEILSGQRNVKDALEALQRDATQILIDAGYLRRR